LLSMSKWANNKYRSIYERSPLSCRHVFTQLHVEAGIMTNAELIIFDKLFGDYSWHQDVIVYIKTDPEICFERMQRRNRDCEKDVTLEYIKAVDQKHTDMIDYIQKKIPDIKIYVVNGNESVETVYNSVASIIDNL